MQIERSLRDLSEQLEAVEAENPRLQLRLAALLREEAALEDRLRENQHRIAARTRENEILRVQQENFILQARAIGKISQYVETAEQRRQRLGAEKRDRSGARRASQFSNMNSTPKRCARS